MQQCYVPLRVVPKQSRLVTYAGGCQYLSLIDSCKTEIVLEMKAAKSFMLNGFDFMVRRLCRSDVERVGERAHYPDFSSLAMPAYQMS